MMGYDDIIKNKISEARRRAVGERILFRTEKRGGT